MRIAIVDDEGKIRTQLEGYLAQFARENHLSVECALLSSGDALLQEMDRGFDILLLDIEMDGIDGMSLARQIRMQSEKVIIIFITNMAQYALEGYEVQALDFMVKPVTYANFSFRMQRALRRLPKQEERYLLIKDGTVSYKLPISRIDYIEVLGHYLIYHIGEKEYKTRGTIREAQAQLNGCHFSRCHNCFLVNLSHVESVTATDVKVAGKSIPLSRYRKQEFMQELAAHMDSV